MLKICKKLQEKRFVFVKILAIIIPENGAKVSKIKCLRLNQQTLNKCKIVQSKLACFWAFLCLWECGECRIHRGNTQCFRDMLLINLQPFVYKGLSLFICVWRSLHMGLSHSRGLAVGLFYPLDL